MTEDNKDNSVKPYMGSVPSKSEAQEYSETGQLDPAINNDISNYSSVLMNLIHNEKTAQEVMAMLTGDPESPSDPFITVPQAALNINDMAVNLMKQSGHDITLDLQIASSIYLVSDLIELGIASDLWADLSEEDIGGVFEDFLQLVIERGLKDGSIDPIQLQLEAEQFMPEDMKKASLEEAEMRGMGSEPSQQAMTQQYANQQVNKERQGAAKTQAQQKAIAQREAGNEVIGRAA